MGNDKKKKRELLATRIKQKAVRAKLKADPERARLFAGLNEGTIVPVDKSKIRSRSVLPAIPDYYRDTWIACKDCGKEELWTAKQQQRWYEEQGGEIEAIAVRCRSCRRKEKLRRTQARQVHFDGLAKKAVNTK